MSAQEVERLPPDARRREIFRLLVTAQDLEMTVAESRQMVVNMWGLSEVQVIQIEREGLAGKWPPLYATWRSDAGKGVPFDDCVSNESRTFSFCNFLHLSFVSSTIDVLSPTSTGREVPTSV